MTVTYVSTFSFEVRHVLMYLFTISSLFRYACFVIWSLFIGLFVFYLFLYRNSLYSLDTNFLVTFCCRFLLVCSLSVL